MIKKLVARLFSILVFCLWALLGFQGANKPQPLFGVPNLEYNPLNLFSTKYRFGNIAYIIILLLAVLLWMLPTTGKQKK